MLRVVCALLLASVLSCNADNAVGNSGGVGVGQSSLLFSPFLTVGAASTASFTFRTASGAAIPDAAVRLSMAGAIFSPNSGTTDATGRFTSIVTPSVRGLATLNVTIAGGTAAFPVYIVSGAPCAVAPIALDVIVSGTVAGTTDCVLNNHPAATYAFSLATGTSTVVQVTAAGVGGNFFPEMVISPEPPTFPRVFCGQTGSAATNGPCEWLLPGGTFHASISSSNGQPGPFRLNVADAGNGAPGCTTRIVPSLNATYTGRALSSTDCFDPTGPFYSDRYQVFDNRPCTVTMRSVTFDTYLEIRDANGTFIAANDSSGGGTDAQVALPSCRVGGNGGSFVIVASSAAPSTFGAYTLTLSFTAAASEGTVTDVRRTREQTLEEFIVSQKTGKDVPEAPDEVENAVDPSTRSGKKKHASTPATEAPPDVQKEEEFERSGSIGRQAHASVRNRRKGG